MTIAIQTQFVVRQSTIEMEGEETVHQGVPRPKSIRPVFRLTVVCSIEPMGVWFNTYMHYELAHAQH